MVTGTRLRRWRAINCNRQCGKNAAMNARTRVCMAMCVCSPQFFVAKLKLQQQKHDSYHDFGSIEICCLPRAMPEPWPSLSLALFRGSRWSPSFGLFCRCDAAARLSASLFIISPAAVGLAPLVYMLFDLCYTTVWS